MKQISWFILLTGIAIQLNAQPGKKTRISCVGASITAGAFLKQPAAESYPGQLQSLLGDEYVVSNFGNSGCTMLQRGDKPYRNTIEYSNALKSQPDIVTIALGGNDSKLINRIHLDELKKDCHDMAAAFAALPSHPRIIILLPVVSFVTDTTGIWEPVIANRIIPLLGEVAYEDGLEVINMHSILIDKPQLFPDKIHPDHEGAGIMAKTLADILLTPRDRAFNIFKQLNQTGKYNNFLGYTCLDFKFNSRDCKVVQPKIAAAGRPWIWRTRFWGHEPQTDLALLERGYHLVYCDAAELLGNAECINLWNGFYILLHSAGLNEKLVMEGMSRGGMYIFNWAIANPDKVVAVYADNPLLNPRAWALGIIKTNPENDMLKAMQKDFSLANEKDIKKYKGGSVDRVAEIVAGHYPILILCADEDEAVSPEDNTNLFEKKVKALNGNINVIHKPGFKHHPHSLPDPTLIVNFILNAFHSYYHPPLSVPVQN